MKKIFYSLFFLGLLSLYSCDSWLELDPIGSKTTDNYIKDYASVVAAYNGVHEVFLNLYTGEYQTLLEAISDDAFVPSHVDGAPYRAFDQLQISEGSGAGFYGSLYTGISRINTALSRIDLLDNESEAQQINYLKGQFLFMRGYFYFTLLKLYGEVPIVPLVNTADDAKQQRATFEALYDRIEEDLTMSSDLMPNSLDNTLGKEYGKPYKYVAHAALADFYLYFEKWNDAKNQADIVINSGNFAKAPYLAVFNREDNSLGMEYSAAYNKEVLLDAYFADRKKQGFTWRITPQGRNIFRAGYGLSSLYCTQNDLDIHNNESNIIPYRGINGGLGIIDEFEPGDKRRADLFWVDNVTAPNTSGYTGTIKYDGLSYGTQSTVNYPVYRYSEVLLMKAEAENELGNLSVAKQVIDQQIRSAANLPASSATNKDEMRTAIFKERRLELAFELKRFFDLNRRGLAAEYIENRQVSVADGGISSHQITNPITGKKNFVFSLPLGEINANPFIDENNPGY